MYRCQSCSSVDTLQLYPEEPYRTCSREVCSACRRFEALNEQISQLESSLTILVNERRNLKSKLNDIHQSIIHRLPVEICTTIFLFCVCRSGGTSPLPSRRPDSPLVLGAVCRAWRQIVWSTPHLWTSLSMMLNPRGRATRIQLAIEWLLRSKQLPLSIQLHSPCLLTNIDAEPFLPLIALINLNAYRWYSLTLDLPDVLLSRFKGPEGVASHMLHKVDIRAVQPNDLNIVRGEPKIVITRNLALENLHFRWQNVSHFSSTDFRIDDVLKVLRRAPQLSICEFRGVGKKPNKYAIGESNWPLVHSRLQSLDIGFDSHCSMAHLFFKSVTLPSLTDFSLNLYSNKIRLKSLTSFLERSESSLRKLSLRGADLVTGKDLVQITKLIPSLSQLLLDFNFSNFTDDADEVPTLEPFYSALSASSLLTASRPSGFNEPLLPQLKTFQLSGRNVFPYEELINLIKGLSASSGTEGVTPLRPLELVETLFECRNDDPLPFIDEPTLDYIATLSQKGVKFVLKVHEVGHGTRDLRDIYAPHGQ